MDYFKPQGTKPLPTTCNTSIGKQNPQNHWKSFSIFANDCPAQLDACFCSDEKASDNTLADCFRIHLVWAKDKIGAANIILSQFNETYNQIWPSLRASFHLTLRLFAPLILTLAVMCLVVQSSHEDSFHFMIASGIILGIMLLIMTDECYIQEYGRLKLWGVSSLVLALIVCESPTLQISILLAAPFIILAITMSLCCYIYVPRFDPGLYYDRDNSVVREIVSHWPEAKRTYRCTPWLVTGDSRTGIPFFLNFIPPQRFIRRWVPSQVPGEQEACILDIAFPPTGHEINKPIYLVLHGLNGGSNEEYIKDFVMRSTANHGSTVAILVTRGLMDSPVVGANLPHFARMTDIDAAAKALRKAAMPNQMVAGVGYSMGAINLATYVALSGKDCPLNTAVCLSGALDTRKQADFHRSKRLWQPMLSKTLRDTFLKKFRDRLEKRLTDKEMKRLSQVDSIVMLDAALMVPYNGYRDLNAYYAEMGAMGDFCSFENEDTIGRMANVSIPLLMISALDDPIGYIDTFIDPKRVCTCGGGYSAMLFTRSGGHVGWPTGMNPTKHAWKWMSEIAISFVESAELVILQEPRAVTGSNQQRASSSAG
jgi:predicted alpha/beta-fold hydrolase